MSVFYSLEATDITVQLATFFNAIKGSFPSQVVWNIPPSGDIIDIASGRITGSWTGGTQASVVGAAAGAYVAGTGAYVRWQTSQIRDGRRMKGRTFLCPINSGLYDTSGTLADATVTVFQTAANALAGTGSLTIYGRERVTGSGDGQAATVTGAVVPDRVTSLRSRRT